jgi:hypothetical protein
MERPVTPQPPQRMSLLIWASLLSGVLFFVAFAWFVTDGGASAEPESLLGSVQLDLAVWGMLAVGGFFGSLHFRRQGVEAVEAARREGATYDDLPLGTLQTQLIVAWALLEGPALFGGVIFMVTGNTTLLAAALGVFLAGMIAAAPRRDWFLADPNRTTTAALR